MTLGFYLQLHPIEKPSNELRVFDRAAEKRQDADHLPLQVSD